MQTFSVNINTATEATSYPLPDYLNQLVTELIDNDAKLITPKILRNSMLSLWSSVPFKFTSNYIGVDAFNPSDRDIKYKLLLGKRSWTPAGLTYSSSHDIMNDVLLQNENDIFIYNVKKDTVSNNFTRMSFLSGVNPQLFSTAPYIQSNLFFSYTQSVSLDINAPGVGVTVSINSLYGTVSVNDIVFPTIVQSSASASNLKVLKWYNGQMIWDFISYPSTNTIGQTGSTLQLLGNAQVNGYSLNFTDSRKVPVQFGDIIPGSKFSGYPLVETLRRMVYPYISPNCSVALASPYSSGYTEVGTSPMPTVLWTLNKRTNNLVTTSLSNMIPGVYPPVVGNGPITVTGSSTGIVISPIAATSTQFKVTVYDGTSYGSASVSLTGIYPYFYGYSSLNVMTTIGLASLTKEVTNKSNKSVFISGSNNLYFIYDSSYGALSTIYDNLGNNVIASFSTSIINLSSPTGFWAGKQFYVYQWNSAPSNFTAVNYQFNY